MDSTSDSPSNICNGTGLNRDDNVNINSVRNNVNISTVQRARISVRERTESGVNDRKVERVSGVRDTSRGNNVSRCGAVDLVSADSENIKEYNGDSGERTVSAGVVRNSGCASGGVEEVENDKEIEELSKLRCQSVATEVVAERYKRRCSDYPGLAFGRSIFSSNTMMKFSVIKNELHNIMNVQLRRVSIYLYIIKVHAL